jgi:hypothetical protein
MNNQGTAVTEQQAVWAGLSARVAALEAATAMSYTASVGGTETVGGWGYFGPWPAGSGFSISGNSVMTPTDGIYAATLVVVATSGAWNGRTLHTFSSPLTAAASTVPGVGEDTASVSVVSQRVFANTAITPAYLHLAGSSRSITATLTIVRLST